MAGRNATSPARTAPVIMWFRQDLRLRDNPALDAAARSGRPIIGLYVWDDEAAGGWALGGAARWWLHGALQALEADWRALGGGPLVLRRGPAERIVPALAAEVGAAEIHWNRMYEPFAVARDTRIKDALKAAERDAFSHKGAVLFEPWEVTNGAGEPYRVFSPFWRACRAAGLPEEPLPAPASLSGWTGDVARDRLEDWGLLPTQPDWAGGLRETWTPGADAAHIRLNAFLAQRVSDYAAARDYPGQPGTSRLSPHLHWGEISPREVVAATRMHLAAHGAGQGDEKSADKFLSEIGWREFSVSLLFHNPQLPENNLQSKFDAFPWRQDATALEAWRRGRTGYPIVDAGMRELYETGWMHNRVRMIVGSFLVKHLLLHWRDGEAWFWDTLVDADLANNAAGWQWIAGCGADAAPYFRVFNPVTQGERYDGDGAYVRRWVPELAKLPDRVLHQPWEARALVLHEAGVRLGETYPHPIVEHKAARQRALDAFETLKAAT